MSWMNQSETYAYIYWQGPLLGPCLYDSSRSIRMLDFLENNRFEGSEGSLNSIVPEPPLSHYIIRHVRPVAHCNSAFLWDLLQLFAMQI